MDCRIVDQRPVECGPEEDAQWEIDLGTAERFCKIAAPTSER
jgi:hypothetical protein